MSHGIALPPSHLFRVYRTGETVQSFVIMSHSEFKPNDGKVLGQQEVFGPAWARVEVENPTNGQITQY